MYGDSSQIEFLRYFYEGICLFCDQAKVSPPRDRKAGSESGKTGTGTHGLFATRTPHRPNPIGLSVCRLVGVDEKTGRVELAEIDIVDRTGMLNSGICDQPLHIPFFLYN